MTSQSKYVRLLLNMTNMTQGMAKNFVFFGIRDGEAVTHVVVQGKVGAFINSTV